MNGSLCFLNNKHTEEFGVSNGRLHGLFVNIKDKKVNANYKNFLYKVRSYNMIIVPTWGGGVRSEKLKI